MKLGKINKHDNKDSMSVTYTYSTHKISHESTINILVSYDSLNSIFC